MKIIREEFIGPHHLIQADCRDVLEMLRPGSFDAVVTDPPYGIGADVTFHKDSGRQPGVALAAKRSYEATDWDAEPVDPVLMDAVRRSGQWQVIFGGNYYALPPTSCWLVWDKQTNGEFAGCELAWTNLPKVVKRLKFMWNGMLRAHGEPRGDHPTQKPIGVMKWCIGHLPDAAATILDPFMGVASTGVACQQMGREFTGIEREPKYFDIACRRIEESMRQPDIFVAEVRPEPAQEGFAL